MKNLEEPSTLAGGVLCLCEACTCVLFLVWIPAALHIKPTGPWVNALAITGKKKTLWKKEGLRKSNPVPPPLLLPALIYIIPSLWLTVGPHTAVNSLAGSRDSSWHFLRSGLCYQCELTFYRSLNPQPQLSGNSQGFEACICGLSTRRIGNKIYAAAEPMPCLLPDMTPMLRCSSAGCSLFLIHIYRTLWIWFG